VAWKSNGGLNMVETIESSCSRECNYQFHECEVDGTPGSECRDYYNECAEKCTEPVAGQTPAVPI